MKKEVVVWALALLFVVVLPCAAFCVVQRMVKSEPISTTQVTESVEVGQERPESAAVMVNVLIADGSVRQMDLEAYLVGVVLGEMPADFEAEALKAQAVVARTYTLKRQSAGQKHSGAVCTDASCCQAYRSTEDYLAGGGTSSSVAKVTDAVAATSGQVLLYNGNLIEATYFSCSGGRTEDAVAVWGTQIPYLQAVDSPGEENAKYHTDCKTFSLQEFAALLNLGNQIETSGLIGRITRTDGGGVDTIVIAGKTFKGTTLRQILDLRSTAFTVIVTDSAVQINTKGFGHRVGMSQYGADAMAVAGNGYKEILSHYYPGTELKAYSQN